MNKDLKLIKSWCIIWDGKRIYWHGTADKKCRVYTDADAVSSTKRVEAKAVLRELAKAKNIPIPNNNVHTDKMAAWIFANIEDEESMQPGWDAKEISRIAKKLGGFPKMYELHDWEGEGRQLMPNAGKHIVERYGSIKKFVAYWGKVFEADEKKDA